MDTEIKKLTRLEILIDHYNFWHKRKVAAEVDMAFNQSIALSGQNLMDDISKQGAKMAKLKGIKERSEKYISVIDNLIKENEKN